MASRTELALRALIAAIEAKSAALPTVLPQPKRNEAIASRLPSLTARPAAISTCSTALAVRKGRTARRVSFSAPM